MMKMKNICELIILFVKNVILIYQMQWKRNKSEHNILAEFYYQLHVTFQSNDFQRH